MFEKSFMDRFAAFLLLLSSCGVSYAQSKKVYKPNIQTCSCNFKLYSSYLRSVPLSIRADSTFLYKADSSFQTVCGYLIVPENRKKASSKMIKLPFIVLKS